MMSILSAISVLPTASRPPAARRRGFSLVEILVATTLLLIITVVISMVFQQAGGAWSAGTGRADTERAVRAVLGSVERDLLNAVDARDYDFQHALVRDPGAGGTEIAFIALQHLYSHDPGKPSGRTPCQIAYYLDGDKVKRDMVPLKFNNGVWSEDRASPYVNEDVVIAGGDSVKNVSFTVLSFTRIERPSDPGGLPLRVEVTAEASHSSSFFNIRGRSSGVNRKLESWTDGESDDIRVGGTL